MGMSSLALMKAWHHIAYRWKQALTASRWPCTSGKLSTGGGPSSLQLQEACKGHQVLPGWQVSNDPGSLFTRNDSGCFRHSRYIAVTHDSHIQVWRTPNHLVREFAPFVLHRTYTGHHDEVLSIQWSPDSKFVLH